MKKITLKDIAKHTGFSVTTVSVALRGSDCIKISDETKESIINAARSLGYYSKPKLQKDTLKKHKKIAILVDAICHDDPFIASLQSLKEACWTHDYIPTIYDFNYNYDFARKILSDIQPSNYIGLVIATQRTGGLPSELVEKVNLPTVLLNCRVSQKKLTAILPSDEQGGYTATQHLIDQGFTRIAHVSGDMSSPAAVNRMKGYKRALSDNDVMINEAWISPGKWTVKNGYDAVMKMLQSKPTPDAIFCSNDMSAVGTYFAIKEAQLEIPSNLAIVGYDDMLICDQLTPKLTTIKNPYREMGYVAIAQLNNEISGLGKGPHTIEVQPELIIRNSTGRH